jgi:hypothetical protein
VCIRVWRLVPRPQDRLLGAPRHDRGAPARVGLAAALLDVGDGQPGESARRRPAWASSSRIARSRWWCAGRAGAAAAQALRRTVRATRRAGRGCSGPAGRVGRLPAFRRAGVRR